MADINIDKFRTTVVRDGSRPSSSGFVESEGQDPVNPPGTNNFVPYSGATDNVDLGEFGVDAGFVTLDTTPTNTPTDQGTIYWDDSRSTAALIMNGTLQHIGQDTFYYVKNAAGGTIAKGTCVGFFGTDGASGHILVFPFLANGVSPSSYFMGVAAEDISAGSFGQVMHFGELTGVNTSGFTAGALLYASTTVAGGFQTTAPVAPNNIILVAAAVNSKNNGAIVVRPQIGSNINTDEGVRITSPTTGDLLQLQVGGLWENKTVAQVIGSAYVPSSRTITINGTTQDLSANRTFNVGTVTSVTATSPLFSSGGATPNITIQQASGSQSGFLSSTDWTTFNNKQNALTNPVTGTGTTNYLPKFTGSTTIGNSQIFDDGTNVGIGTATPAAKLDISGGDLYVRTGGTIYANTLAPYSGNMTISLGGSGNNLIVSGGNVGIGTSSPNGLLHVKSSGAYGSLLVDNTGTTGGGYFASLQNGSTKGIVAVTGAIEGNTTSDFGMFAETGGALRFYVNGSATRVMSLTSGGNLLVGTTSDNGARLQVSGAATVSSSVTAASLISALATFSNFGSETAAVVAFADGNTGFFRPALNTLGITTAGTERMRITSGGNVGIGTPSPNQRLEVNGRIRVSSNGSNGGDMAVDDGGIAFSTQGSTPIAFWRDNYTNQSMRIFAGGNVFIGPSPSDNGARLQVSGAGVAFNFTTSNGLIGNINSSAANGGYITWQTSGTTIADLGTAQQVFGAGGSDTFGINARGARSLILGTNNTARLTITSGGNVGIGIDSPSYPLQVRRAGGAGSLGISIDSVGTTDRVAQYFAIQDNASGAGTGHAFYYRVPSSTTDVLGLFLNESGSVGIGTPSPAAKLEVKQTGSEVPFIIDSSAAANAAYTLYQVNNSGGWEVGMAGVNDGYKYLFSYGEFSAANSKVAITNTGNFLIGTTTSTGAKLEVNGDIRTGALDGGYVSGFWKLGRAVTGTQPSETHQIIVEINGALFTIGAAAI